LHAWCWKSAVPRLPPRYQRDCAGVTENGGDRTDGGRVAREVPCDGGKQNHHAGRRGVSWSVHPDPKAGKMPRRPSRANSVVLLRTIRRVRSGSIIHLRPRAAKLVHRAFALQAGEWFLAKQNPSQHTVYHRFVLAGDIHGRTDQPAQPRKGPASSQEAARRAQTQFARLHTHSAWELLGTGA
jgi:hypothetical protein